MNTDVHLKIEGFFTRFKHHSYRKGDILIRADDQPQGIFYLKEGNVKQYTISKKGEELVVNVFQPIAFFPMTWAINNTPNEYFYEAMTDVDIWIAPKEKVLVFIKREPDALYDLMSRVYKGIDGLERRMAFLMGGSAYARLVTELVIQAKRFGNKKDNSVEMKISEKDLASQTGITRETVSRQMRILKDKGLVVFNKNKFVITNLQKLEENSI